MRLGLVLSLALVVGCAGYNLTSIDYRSNPGPRGIWLATGKNDTRGRELGSVAAEFKGRDTCQTAMTRVLKDLLDQSRALGGNAVKDVQFRGRWNWTGRLVCKGGSSGWRSVTVRAMGIAIIHEGLTSRGAPK